MALKFDGEILETVDGSLDITLHAVGKPAEVQELMALLKPAKPEVTPEPAGVPAPLPAS